MNQPNLEAFSKLKSGSHIHLMGICGTAMGSLAGILKEKGFNVTGSDENVYPPMSTQLENLVIKIKKGFVKENLDPKPDFVVVGNVMTKKMEEVLALLESDIPYSSFPAVIGEMFLKNKEALVCCGTHGKTTTTSMAAWALECLEIKPGYLIGGVPENFEYSFSSRKSEWFVIEGDEYDTAFFDKVPKYTHYHPKNSILTGIEFDHVDIYDDLTDVISAFSLLIDSIPDTDDSVLVYNGDDENIKALLKTNKPKCWTLSYGLKETHHAVLVSEKVLPEGTEVVFRIGDREFEFFGSWFGTFNSLNFLAVMTLLDFKAFDLDTVMESASTFKGVKRRQQCLLSTDNIKVFEDFAHHPTAVRLTVDSFKKRFPDQKLICVFEPRSATSRRSIFQKDYVKSFKSSDVSVIAPVIKKTDQDTFSTHELAKNIRAENKIAHSPENKVDLINTLIDELTGSDVVLFMSNGSFDAIPQDFVKKIANNSQ